MKFFGEAPACLRHVVIAGTTPEALRMLRHPFYADKVFDGMHAKPMRPLMHTSIRPRIYGTTSHNKVGVCFDALMASIPSGVPEQPRGDETLRGAHRRAEDAAKIGAAVLAISCPAEVTGIGLENGLRIDDDGTLHEVATAAVVYFERTCCTKAKFSDDVDIVLDPDYPRDTDVPYGVWFAKKYSLETKDSWYAYCGKNRACIFADRTTAALENLENKL